MKERKNKTLELGEYRNGYLGGGLKEGNDLLRLVNDDGRQVSEEAVRATKGYWNFWFPTNK